MTDILSIKTALISVSDKTGITEFGKSLADQGVALLSTGGTHKALQGAGQAVKAVEDVTGFPEMMDGRVKTLHPKVHGGLLARRDLSDHLDAAREHDIGLIDLLVVNLYPFEATIARGASYDEAVENIDIGGPAMVRAAAKNHASVVVITDPADYELVLAELVQHGGVQAGTAKRLAQKAYAHTAAYDAAISGWLADALQIKVPAVVATGARLKQTMRYGENPHQSAAFYVKHDAGPGIATATQLQGKELSYNNINDTDAAFALVSEFDPADGPACAIIKHANPCGVARGKTLAEAYSAAFDCDRTSAFGGIIALNQPLDGATAEKITDIFTEVVIAPGADDAAKAVFETKKNLRLLLTDGLADPRARGRNWRQVNGGYLVQDEDTQALDPAQIKTVTKRAPSQAEMSDLLFAWTVAKHVKSNAIIYAKDHATVGIGAGQMSRIDSTRIAAWKARDAAEVLGMDAPQTQGSVVASDAFFPFEDGLRAAAEAGATALIQPGGAMRDAEVIAAADELGLAMVFTAMRHFRH